MKIVSFFITLIITLLVLGPFLVSPVYGTLLLLAYGIAFLVLLEAINLS